MELILQPKLPAAHATFTISYLAGGDSNRLRLIVDVRGDNIHWSSCRRWEGRFKNIAHLRERLVDVGLKEASLEAKSIDFEVSELQLIDMGMEVVTDPFQPEKGSGP